MMKHPSKKHVAPLIIAAIATFFFVGGQATQEGFATGSVTLTRQGPAPVDISLSPELRFLQADQEELGKHDLGFRPVEESLWSANDTTTELSVIATRSGEDGNGVEISKLLSPPSGLESVAIQTTYATTGGTSPSLPFVFLSGAIAICAMILPGVSGAFLLLLLGQYHFVLFHLRGALSGAAGSGEILLVFLAGITFGILAFSRVLHLLLTRAHDATMAVLMGLMIGSLRKLWPYQSSDGEMIIPSSFETGDWVAAGAALVGILIIAGFLKLDQDKQPS